MYISQREIMVICIAKNIFTKAKEISYPDSLNGQSGLLGDFFMSKSYGILNFMIV
jgi:hypothetical protein